MNILTIKQASLEWGISERRITFLCSQGRIAGAEKIAGAWLLPKDVKKPADARVKSGKYKNWRNKTVASSDFQSNLINLQGSLAVEDMTVSDASLHNLRKIDSGEASYTDVIEELKSKYMQRV